MAERNKDGTFKKGTTPNPGGRPKGIRATVRELSNDGSDYIILLDKWARDESQPIKVRKDCISELLDRGFGKAVQYNDNTHTFNSTLSDLLGELDGSENTIDTIPNIVA
jgi:hypothetical protein